MLNQGRLQIKLILFKIFCQGFQAIAIFMCFNVVANVVTEVPGLFYYENFNAIYFFIGNVNMYCRNRSPAKRLPAIGDEGNTVTIFNFIDLLKKKSSK